nr:uncharacterized protein LOC113820794 [Penaeus vannamei]
MLVFLVNAVVTLFEDFTAREISSKHVNILEPPYTTLTPSTIFIPLSYHPHSTSMLYAYQNNVRPELANYMMMLAASPWIGSRRLFMTAEGQTQLVKLQGEFEKLLEEKKMNVTQIIDRVSLDCEEMIIQCSFNENEIQGRDCCRLFTPVPTFTGKCYVFFANESFSQLFSGEMGGLIITLHQVENDEPGGERRAR